jgi:putative ABC transport system permease protein
MSRPIALLRVAHAGAGRLPGLATILALAAGVALITAVLTLNAAALAELERATAALSGRADLLVEGPRAGFDEALYAKLASLPEVAAANPVVEQLIQAPGGEPLRLLGLDPFRLLELSPARYAELVPFLPGLLAPDAVLVKADAARAAQVSGRIVLGGGELRVLGRIGSELAGEADAVMDIASAQRVLGVEGRLSRIELRLAADEGTARAAIARLLPAGVFLSRPTERAERSESLSRAYRANLAMLALAAVLTGAYLVHATKSLAVQRRRAGLGLLRALGATRGEIAASVVAGSALEGVAGGLLGVALGLALARFAFARLVGAPGGAALADPALDPAIALAGLAIGVVAAVLGALAPARTAARLSPVAALKPLALAGPPAHSRARLALGLALAALAIPVAARPPVAGLPLCGYLAVALFLLAALLVLPAVAEGIYRMIPPPRRMLAGLALRELRATSGRAGLALGSLVVSFSLAVAMAIMVDSFRDSFRVWLDHVLPADLNLRLPAGVDRGAFSPAEQAALAALPGVRLSEFRRTVSVLVDPTRPPVTLIARPLNAAAPVLPLLARTQVPQGALAFYASEAMVDLYGWRLGESAVLPLNGRPLRGVVAGIWRDYARSFGAVAMPLDRYRALTGDADANEAAFWVLPGREAELTRELRKRVPPARADLYASPELKLRSLAIFDRTFAVTYALEAVALGIGLLGVGLSFGALALARRAEFAVLRHLGLTRAELARLLLLEGLVLAAIGVAYGLALGTALSLLLVEVIDRQSFHWSLDLAVPGARLLVAALLLGLAAGGTALLAARAATTGSTLRAVREDW